MDGKENIKKSSQSHSVGYFSLIF